MKIRTLTAISLFIASTNIICAQAYQYPNIPDSIVGREIRISYMLQHYWDNADFSDSTLLVTPKVTLDYLYLLDNSQEKEKQESMEYTISTMVSNHALGMWLFGMDMYLHSPDSQFHNDELYLQTLEIIMKSDADSVFKDAASKIREIISKNNIGSTAENFTFILKDGKRQNLHDIEAPLLLVIFNNPGCSRCKQTEEEITNNKSIQKLIKKKKLKILAICPTDDFEKWKTHDYPSNWTSGYDIDSVISSKRLYEILQFPSIYLLDKDKKVIIKEGNYEKLCDYFKYNSLY